VDDDEADEVDEEDEVGAVDSRDLKVARLLAASGEISLAAQQYCDWSAAREAVDNMLRDMAEQQSTAVP
jgi:hypothetical protein